MKKQLVSSLILGCMLFAFAVVPALAQTDPYGLDYAANSGLGTNDLREGIMQIVRILFTFLGVLTIIMMLYGGFLWLTSAGNEDKVGQAKKIITSAIIGLVIIFISYAIAQFVIQGLASATGANTN